MTESTTPPNQKRLPYYYVLQYQHKQHYSIYGSVDYGTKVEGELERLQECAKELALQNPWLKYWVAERQGF